MIAAIRRFDSGGSTEIASRFWGVSGDGDSLGEDCRACVNSRGLRTHRYDHHMAEPAKKPFALRADQIRPRAMGYGACFASDMITRDGRKVAFMYREEAEFDVDSGWRFFSGYETDEYANDPSNVGIYDVNTIANYDPEIVPLLNEPIGSVFERNYGSGPFFRVYDWSPPKD
jgi:hypothetical protein